MGSVMIYFIYPCCVFLVLFVLGILSQGFFLAHFIFEIIVLSAIGWIMFNRNARQSDETMSVWGIIRPIFHKQLLVFGVSMLLSLGLNKCISGNYMTNDSVLNWLWLWSWLLFMLGAINALSAVIWMKFK
jgi:hypothetical protein